MHPKVAEEALATVAMETNALTIRNSTHLLIDHPDLENLDPPGPAQEMPPQSPFPQSLSRKIFSPSRFQ